MVVDPQTPTRQFIKKNPSVVDTCKKFGESARQVVSIARETGASIETVIAGFTSQAPVAHALVVR